MGSPKLLKELDKGVKQVISTDKKQDRRNCVDRVLGRCNGGLKCDRTQQIVQLCEQNRASALPFASLSTDKEAQALFIL